MANDACIDYNYYNNPRFRLFGGPELPSYSRQLKNIQDQNIKDLPLPLQLAIGDVLVHMMFRKHIINIVKMVIVLKH